MIEIPVKGADAPALVDDSDASIANFRWYADADGYARRTYTLSGHTHNVFMHRQVLDAKRGEIVDHVNGNRLDNRRANLRLVTSRGNAANRRPHGSSGYKGVTRLRKIGMWQAQIEVNGKSRYLGAFADPLEAARAYDRAAREAFGDTAWTNEAVRP